MRTLSAGAMACVLVGAAGAPAYSAIGDGAHPERAKPTSSAAGERVEGQTPLDHGAWGLRPTVKSLLLPGWGQMSLDRETRGAVMGVGFLGGTFGAWMAVQAKNHAYADYLTSTETPQLQHNFELANKYYRLQNFLAVVAIGSWAWSWIDAMRGVPEDRHGSPRVQAVPLPVGAALALRF